jgi:uncharacterized damage-inducible protein DinB
MNKELLSIISNLENVLSGDPWYGRAVYELLEEVHPAVAYIRPGDTDEDEGHSLADLLYHMLTWAQFTLVAVQGKTEQEVRDIEKLDWRVINPPEHTWEKGLKALKETHRQLLEILHTKDDTLLEQTVPARTYNYRALLNGLIQHNIYHIGQVAYVTKYLASE